MEKKKIIKIAIIIVAVIILSILFSLINVGNNTIYNNIKIQNVLVSKRTQEDAKSQLLNIFENKKKNQIKLFHGEYQTTISYDQLNVEHNIDEVTDKAYSVGRKGNIITNNYTILSTIFLQRNLKLDIKLNEEELQKAIEEAESKLPDVTTEYTYYIEDDNLTIKAGKPGVKIKKDELKSKIIDSIKNFNIEGASIEIPVEQTEPEKIDIDKVLQDIIKKPKNAYISTNPTKVHAEEKGIDIAITKEEVQQIISENKEEYTIPLKIIQPSITVSSLGKEAYTDKLASFTTRYDASNVNRNNNLNLAAKKLHETIVNPGETFSYNKTIGERTIAAGFKEAAAYAGGDVVLDVGGGICQLSSTLYNVALLSNMEIVERHNHSFQTSYVEAGRDATVSWGTLDFKFKNNRNYPIKIKSEAVDGVVEVSIYGIKEVNDPIVIVQSKVTGLIERKTEYKEDKTLKKGQEVVEREGEDGCTSETTKQIVENGIIRSKEVISKDTYNALSKIIRRNK